MEGTATMAVLEAWEPKDRDSQVLAGLGVLAAEVATPGMAALSRLLPRGQEAFSPLHSTLMAAMPATARPVAMAAPAVVGITWMVAPAVKVAMAAMPDLAVMEVLFNWP